MVRSTGSGTRLAASVLFIIVVGGAGTAWGDFTFGEPVNLGATVNSSGHDNVPCVSLDGLELYFGSDERPGGQGGEDLWVSIRSTTANEWGVPENLGPLVNNSASDNCAAISGDGLELYFTSWREGGMGSGDLWVTKRATRNDPWGEAVNVGAPVNSAGVETFPSLSPDGLELYFTSGRYWDSGASFVVTRRESRDAPWGEPGSLGLVINSWPHQVDPSISSDGFALVFCDWWENPRPDGYGNGDLWLSLRTAKNGEWGEPMNLGGRINTGNFEGYGMISADGSLLYFTSGRWGGSGGVDLWQVPIVAVVDFDNDGVVGMSDLLQLIECWETDDPVCDIGPMPWGDGVVDAADLEVLMKSWGQTLGEPLELLAHWKLDESEGTIAYDAIGTSHANLIGDPIWQPEGGQIDGALLLDGVGDGLQAEIVVDPIYSACSVFAWVKGGGPGQTIISQAERGYWLMTDQVEGYLTTQLKQPNFGRGVLESRAQITDGEWHHVGLAWDMWIRTLYVDYVEVARDETEEALFELPPSEGKFHIGAPPRLNFPGYWSGLIDDVRIYNRAVEP